MPVISHSTYKPPLFFANRHVQTVFPGVFRRVSGVHYRRERIDTPDDDFLDLDFSAVGSRKLAIMLHGLEGDSQRAYMRGMARALNRGGWDALAMNFRSCSGECNRKLRFYHSGETQDLDTIVSYVMDHKSYSEIALVGFSLGGNVILKYLGERMDQIRPVVRKAVTFSVPCNLRSCSEKLSEPENRIYLKRFLRMLHQKIHMKMQIMPDKINDKDYDRIKTFKDYDDRYTAPIHGFANAYDYWEKASCKPFLHGISIPTLLVNSADDPFLSRQCYPVAEAEQNPHLFLEIPENGGHVGFVAFNYRGEYWSETRAVEFLNH